MLFILVTQQVMSVSTWSHGYNPLLSVLCMAEFRDIACAYKWECWSAKMLHQLPEKKTKSICIILAVTFEAWSQVPQKQGKHHVSVFQRLIQPQVQQAEIQNWARKHHPLGWIRDRLRVYPKVWDHMTAAWESAHLKRCVSPCLVVFKNILLKRKSGVINILYLLLLLSKETHKYLDSFKCLCQINVLRKHLGGI